VVIAARHVARASRSYNVTSTGATERRRTRAALAPGRAEAYLPSMLQPSPAFMTRARPLALARWLWFVAGLIVLMVMVGGITRLTESGLSITEWKPLSGAIPPLTQAQWQAEFAAYQRIPEYQQLNRGMTLAEFKGIYFWEFAHRLLGRVIGLAFALPLLCFAVRRRIPAGYGWRLTALLALGGLQGAVGWWMVKSGLAVRTDVSHVRLAVHLGVALFTLGGIAWTALDLQRLARDPLAIGARLTGPALAALALLAVQIVLGAFTAGLDAGYAFSSWPLMGDAWFPADAPMLAPAWRNAIDNPIVVQFLHRWFAFAAAAALVALAWRAHRAGGRRAGAAVVWLVALQIALGISTLLTGVALPIAVAHQVNAALLLVAAVAAAHTLGQRRG
jgi:heme a synthase